MIDKESKEKFDLLKEIRGTRGTRDNRKISKLYKNSLWKFAKCIFS